LDYAELDDPYPIYAALRDRAPVYRNPDRDIWVLSRFDDVQAAARNWQLFSSSAGVDLDNTAEVFGPGDFIALDPPRHDALRKVVKHHFSPKAIADLEEPIERAAHELIDRFQADETIDFAEQFANVIPVRVVSGPMGFPAADEDELVRWYQAMIERRTGEDRVPASVIEASRQLREYFEELLLERGASPRDDVMSEILVAEAAGDLSREESLGLCYLLFTAGIETTAGLIASSLMHLGRERDQLAYLRANLDDIDLMRAAVEELLRYDSPIQQFARITTEDTDLHGITIPAGSRVVLIYASANRDERRFDHPEVLNLARPVLRNLAFGEGIHHCLGAPLARPEARIAIRTLLSRVPDYEIAGEIERTPTHTSRGLSCLPVRVSAIRDRPRT
jgi:cytochrome P450